MRDELIPWAPAGLSSLLVDLSRQALALQYQTTPTIKPDGSLVTPADTILEDQLGAFLAQAEPNSFMIGEETLGQKGPDYLAKAMAGRSWVIDPIDGTALFALDIAGWGISIGLMEAGKMVHGVVAYPQRSVYGPSLELMWSEGEGVAQSIIPLGPDSAVCVAELVKGQIAWPVRPMIKGYPGQISASQRFAKGGSYRGKHQIICFASSVIAFHHLMSGSLVAYLVKLKLWDLAGAMPLAWRLGLRACMPDGQPIDLAVTDLAWRTDPHDPQFLGLRDHILIYWPDRISPEIWADISLPKL